MLPVDAETRAYFAKVANTLQQGDLTEKEDIEIFVSNVMDEMKNREIQLACDKRCSKVVEQVVSLSNAEQLSNFFKRLNKPFVNEEEMEAPWIQSVEMMFHCNGSHSIQTAIEKIPYLVMDKANKDFKLDSILIDFCQELFKNAESKEELPEGTTEIDKAFSSVLYQAISDRYASHVLKAILLVLNGQLIEKGKVSLDLENTESHKRKHLPVSSNITEKLAKQKMPMSFEIMKKKIMHTISLFDIQNMVVNVFANPVLQLVLELSENKNLFIEKVLKFDSKDSSVADEQMRMLLQDSIASHFIEKVFQVASGEMWSRLYTNYFRHKLADLSLHPITNFTVQQCIRAITQSAQLEMIFDELHPIFKTIIENGKLGVISSLIDASVRLKSRQKQISKALLECVPSSEESGNVVRNILSIQKKKFGFSPLGSQIIQALLRFDAEYIKSIIDGFLSLDVDFLIQLSKDYAGARAVEEFTKASTVTPKQKQTVIDKLKGSYAQLATDKYASHIVEACYFAAELSRKEAIAKELANAEKELSKSVYGRFTLKKCQIEKFRRKKQEWATSQTQNDKKRKMFADIIDDAIPSKKTKQPASAKLEPESTMELSKKKVKEEKKETEDEIDEIDELFSNTSKKQPSDQKKQKQKSESTKEKRAHKEVSADADDAAMASIFSAVSKGKKK